MRLYSARAALLASMTGVITVDLASNQSCDFEDIFAKADTLTAGVSPVSEIVAVS